MSGHDRPATDAERAAFYAGLPRKRIGAGALITDPHGRVLIVEPTYKPAWEVPGGIVEVSETASAACRRECREELGLGLQIGRLLVVEHQTEPGYRGDSIMFIYDGGVMVDLAGIRLAEAEVRSCRFVAVDELASLMTPKLARRLRCAVTARAEGITIELENGVLRAALDRGHAD